MTALVAVIHVHGILLLTRVIVDPRDKPGGDGG
jgi:hypothetical protein